MSLFSELKRRSVLRMAIIYVVAAWLVMQVTEVLIGLGALPERIGLWVLAVLASGFPIAVIISWFFDLTPAGIVREADVPEGQPAPAVGGRRMDFAIIAMLAAAVILLLFWEPPVSEDEALTVLPFESLTGPDEASFSEGVSIELLNLLAQLRRFKVKQTPEASIIARFADIPTLAREMNVRWVLQGSVRRAEQRVRIAVQLLDAKDDMSITWSNVFDRDYNAENLFDIQSEIARAITDRLRMTLTGEDEARLARVPTKNTEAYTAYLIGRDRLRDRKVGDLEDAVEQFAKAIELDPQFAGAYSGLADACALYETFSGGFRSEHCPASRAGLEQLARKAVELDPGSGEAWVSLGFAIACQADGALEECIREKKAAYERGLELNPSHSQGYHWYGMVLMQDQLYPDPDPQSGWIEAWQAGVWESVLKKGLEADPLSIPLHYMTAIHPAITQSKEEAIRHAQRMVEIAPDSPRGYEKLGEQAWILHGRLDESIRWESQARERDPHHVAYATSMGRAYAELGDPDMALAWFDLAKALVAPDNQPRQNRLLVEQAIIRLVSDPEDADKAAELDALLDERVAIPPWMMTLLGVYVDLTLGQPEDALARIEKLAPDCIGTIDTLEDAALCPTELVRVYQELGDVAAARNLGDTLVQQWKTWSDAYPGINERLVYATALATTRHTGQALGVLETLVSSGWRGHYGFYHLRFTLCCDVSFDAIRDDERFQAMVATIEADMAQQLENVREMQRRGEVPTLEEVKALVASGRESG